MFSVDKYFLLKALFLLCFGTYQSLNALSVAEDRILLTFCEATESSLNVCREINCNLVKEIETRRRKTQRNEKLWINAWLDDFRFIITSLHQIVGQLFVQISMRNVILWVGTSWIRVLLDFGADIFSYISVDGFYCLCFQMPLNLETKTLNSCVNLCCSL